MDICCYWCCFASRSRDTVCALVSGVHACALPILGAGFTEQGLAIEHSVAGLRLQGGVGLPTASRASADQQYFYVNGRAVRDRLVAHAVRQAYRDVLFNGRHPTFVLFFEVDPAEIGRAHV